MSIARPTVPSEILAGYAGLALIACLIVLSAARNAAPDPKGN
jgi:hypothetical protein